LTSLQSTIQGHPYSMGDHKVIALESSTQPRVLMFNEKMPWESCTLRVSAVQLTPLPVRYLHGAIQ